MSLSGSNMLEEWKVMYSKRDEYVAKKQRKAIESLSKSKRKNKEELIKNMKLTEFDKYLFNELHKKIRNRDTDKKENDNDDNDDYMTLNELSITMKWKLFRGQFRPRLQKLIDSNNKNDVIKCTKNAFKSIYKSINKRNNNINDMNGIKLSIKELTKLKGVGVATASLILAIYTKIIPFMADESMLAISPGLTLKYDMKTYINYAEKLVTKCNTLNRDGKDDEFMVTPFVLGECLWTDYMIKKLSDIDHKNGKQKKGKKRKANDDMICSQPAKKRRL